MMLQTAELTLKHQFSFLKKFHSTVLLGDNNSMMKTLVLSEKSA
jgi:hypothetical protein